MPIALNDLLTPQTTDQVKVPIVNMLAAAGFPTTSWQAGSVPRTLVESEANPYADLTALIASIAGGGFTQYATGGWMDLLAQNTFNLTRLPGTYTQGIFQLADVTNAGPFTLQPGAVYVVASGGLRYLNTAQIIVPQGGTATGTFAAELVGIAYNLPFSTAFSLQTSLPGVTVVPFDPNGLSVWIAQQGANVESDQQLATRCLARWGTLGGGATQAAYQSWALTSTAEITKVSVQANVPGNGQVAVYVAGAVGAVSGAGVAAAQAYIAPRAPLCVQATVTSAAVLTVQITGSVLVKAANIIAAQVKATQNLTAFFAALQIGALIYRSAIVEQIMIADPTIADCKLSVPLVDLQLTPTQAAAYVSTLTWTTY